MEIIEKACSKCKLIKPLSEFHKASKRKLGIRSSCKECNKKPIKIKPEKTHKKCYDCKQIKILNEFNVCNRNKDKKSSLCRICSKIQGELYRQKEENKVKAKLYKKQYKNNNPDYQKNYTKQNRHKINIQVRNKRKSNIQFKITNNLRSRLHDILKYKNIEKTFQSHNKFLGCSANYLKNYLESLFEPWMNWDNHGAYNKTKRTWHIDHIIPLSSFDFTKESEVKIACHYLNLRPLCAYANLNKFDKIPKNAETIRNSIIDTIEYKLDKN